MSGRKTLVYMKVRLIKVKKKLRAARLEAKIANKALAQVSDEVADLEEEVKAKTQTVCALRADLGRAKDMIRRLAAEAELCNKRRFAAEELLYNRGMGKVDSFFPELRR